MKSSKLLLSILVVLVVLSLNFSPACAQDTQPPDAGLVAEGVGADVLAPSPISPYFAQQVYTRTPKFLFTPHPEATSYRVRVYNEFTPTDPLYTFPGSGNCNATLCSLQPTYKLKVYQWDWMYAGHYLWDVEALINNHWQNTSSQTYFSVWSKGFTSTFDVNAKIWMQVNGDWVRTSKGYYKTIGKASSYSTALEIESFNGNYVYEVRLKRKVETEPNWIIFNGAPNPLLPNGQWNRANILEYSNSGSWKFILMQDGVPHEIASGASPYIVPFGWNTWTIWTNHPNIYIWVNEVLVAIITDPVETRGFVGVGMYQSGSESSPLLVDYAKLYYSSIQPMEIPEEVNTGLE